MKSLKCLGLTAVAVIALVAAGCSESTEPEGNYGGSSVVAESDLFIKESAQDLQTVTVDDADWILPVTVALEKAVSKDVTFTLTPDSEWLDEYNEAHPETAYRMLPDNYYALRVKHTIAAGETEQDAPLSVTMPADAYAVDYVLPLHIADVSGPAAIKSGSHRVVYAFIKGNFVIIEQSAASTDSYAVSMINGPTELPIDLSIIDPLAEDLTVSLKADQAILDAYNAETGSDYVLLPAEYYDWTSDVIISAGELNGSAPVMVNYLPENDKKYAVAVSIDSTSNSNLRVREGQGSWIYLLRRAAGPVIQKSAVFTGFGSNRSQVATLNLGSHAQWSLEYWVRFDDITSYNYDGDSDDWLSGASDQGNWRRYVYSPQCVTVGLPSPMDFKFWPQADQPIGPQFQLTNGSVMSATTTNGGYDWRPDKWVHIVFTYDGSNVRYYINGKIQKFGGNTSGGVQSLTGETVAYANATSWSNIQFIYARANLTTHATTLKIEMAQLRLWSRVLDAEELAENYTYNVNPDSAENLEAYWKMDEGAGTTLTDCSGNGHDITWSYLQWSDTEYDFTNLNK